MEILLLWLDDLDDLAFCLVSTWDRGRIRALETGLFAALALPVLCVSDVWAPLISSFALTACGCVAFWLAGLLGTGILEQRPIGA